MPETPPSKPPKSLLRKVGRAIADYRMIRDGDRILLGVSGGKDSLSLLLILKHLQSYAPVRFDLGVITVDPEVDGFDPSSLTSYYESLGLPWYLPAAADHGRGKDAPGRRLFCAYCARMKRGIMYSTCREHGYNVLALAQHLDDLAESFLMSAFHQGKLGTMKAHYVNDAGDIRDHPAAGLRARDPDRRLSPIRHSCRSSPTPARPVFRSHPTRPYEEPAGARGKRAPESLCQSAACHAAVDGQ